MPEINKRLMELRKTLGISRREFGEKIGATDSVIKNLEYNYTEPKEYALSQICAIYNVNEDWLRTGEGEMFREKTKEEEIEEIFGDVLKDDTTFKYHLLLALAQLDSAGWDAIEKFFKEVMGE